jgi:hypothetical protein
MRSQPENEQRRRIVSRIMHEGEPRMWGNNPPRYGVYWKTIDGEQYHMPIYQSPGKAIIEELLPYYDRVQLDWLRENVASICDKGEHDILIEEACLILPLDKEHRRVYRADNDQFMGYITGLSLKGCRTLVDAVEVQPEGSEFRFWHNLDHHVKFSV